MKMKIISFLLFQMFLGFHSLLFTPFLAPLLAKGTEQSSSFASGFTANSKDPIKIEADNLEVRDKEQLAIFKGNVEVIQAQTTLRTSTLKVYYKGNSKSLSSNQDISKLEAFGGVVIISKDQTATGKSAIVNVETDIATLIGDVVLTQGGSVAKGNKLIVQMKTGKYTLIGDKKTGRVKILLERDKKK